MTANFKDDVQANVVVPVAQLLEALKKAISLGKNVPVNTKAVELVAGFLTKVSQELNNEAKAAADISQKKTETPEDSFPSFTL